MHFCRIDWKRWSSEEIFNQFNLVDWLKIFSDICTQQEFQSFISNNYGEIWIPYDRIYNKSIGFIFIYPANSNSTVIFHGGSWSHNPRINYLCIISLLDRLFKFGYCIKTTCLHDNLNAYKFLQSVGFVRYARSGAYINLQISEKDFRNSTIYSYLYKYCNMDDILKEVQQGKMLCSDNKDMSNIYAFFEKQNIEVPSIDKRRMNRIYPNKDYWCRNLSYDFSSSEKIYSCILYGLKNYPYSHICMGKTTTYQEIISLDYEDIFLKNNISKIRNTLIHWEGSVKEIHLPNKSSITTWMKKHKPTFDKLSYYTLEDFVTRTTYNEIKQLVLNLMAPPFFSNATAIDTITKILHTIHPQLFIPIDIKYSINYFTNYKNVNIPKKINHQVDWIMSINRCCAIFFLSNKTLFIKTSMSTGTPITELLYNMLIGFAKYREDYLEKFDSKYIENINRPLFF